MSAAFKLQGDPATGLRAEGDLTLDTAVAALAAGLAVLPRQGRCTIDLVALGATDSAGLAVLIEWLAQARARDTQLAYLNLPSALRSLAQLSGIEFLFTDPPGA